MMKIEENRIYSLDYLRGIMASAVMVYHYSYWAYGDLDSSTVLGRLGIFGVSFFYILSGLTLFIVYSKRHFDWYSLKKFWIKRFFRIYPLLWLVTLLYIIIVGINDSFLIFLNLSGLFGFIKPEAGIGTGVWSIGNELVFYSLFPIILLGYRKNRVLFYGMILVTLSIGAYFTFFVLTSLSPLEEQWKIYVNPFNQFFFFTSGILVGHLNGNFFRVTSFNLKRAMVVVLVLFFCFYPVSGDTSYLVSSWNRVLFTLICFLICGLVYSGGFELKGVLHKSFYFLGESCYSIYLLHPIGYKIVGVINNYTFNLGIFFLIPISICTTLLMSYLCYNYLEKPLINLGGRIVSNNGR